MLLSTTGIVIQSIKYSENARISKIISKEKGLITVISTGLKSKKNKQGIYFQPLSAINFVCYISNKSTLYRIKEISFDNNLQPTFDVNITAIRFFLSEILNKVIREEEQNLELYNFLEQELLSLYTSTTNISHFPLKFLIDLLEFLGIKPELSKHHMYFDLIEGRSTNELPPHSNFSRNEEFILYINFYCNHSRLNKLQRKQLLNLLLQYYNVQLSAGFENLKSKAVLEMVLA